MFDKPINRWWTVVAGALGNAVGTGVVATYVLGVFVKDISADFGWERSYTTAGISCLFIVSGFGSLALGALMARYSIRAITILFVALYSLAVMAVGFMPNSLAGLALLSCAFILQLGPYAFPVRAQPAMPPAVSAPEGKR